MHIMINFENDEYDTTFNTLAELGISKGDNNTNINNGIVKAAIGENHEYIQIDITSNAYNKLCGLTKDYAELVIYVARTVADTVNKAKEFMGKFENTMKEFEEEKLAA